MAVIPLAPLHRQGGSNTLSMHTKRLYDPHDTHSTSIMTPSSYRQTSWSFCTTSLFLLLGSCCYHGQVGATPLGRTGGLERREDTKSSSISPKVWIPVAVVIILLSIVAVMSWKRKTPSLFTFSGAAAASPLGGGAGGRTRELTAEQLAGTINNGGRREVTATELAGGDAGPPRPARRTRRPRRTPSQMSVTSLPVYNKEPGEEEVVIFRGRDMEDVTMPAAAVRESVEEDEDEDDSMDRSHSRESRYSEMPTSPHDMPLLHNDEDSAEGDLSMQGIQTPAQEAPRRRSLDTGSPETGPLTRSNTRNSTRSNNPADPRGEAPPYFEVVDHSTVNLNDDQNSNNTTSPSTSPEPVNPVRRSGFRGLLNRMSIVGSSSTSGHARNPSSMSALSSNLSLGHALEPSQSRISHRTTPSGGSGFMFRTLSRQRSINTLNNSTTRLTSPSMISLNSISAPLTHTATRTEFTYPKTGPTPEQIKVISSRETFTRFGVPYGADAIAYASSSRLDLAVPPPDFETVANERAASPGPSRLRSVSNVAETAATGTAPSRQSMHSHSSSTGSAASVPSNSTPSTPAMTSTEPSASTNTESQVTSEAVAATSLQSTSSPVSASRAHIPSPEPPHPSDTQNRNTKPSPTLSLNISTSPPAASSPTSVNEFGTLDVPAAGSSTLSGTARSHATFATAAESMTPSTRTARTGYDAEFFDASSDLGEHNDSPPSTPRIGGHHALEATDATVTPGSPSQARAHAQAAQT